MEDLGIVRCIPNMVVINPTDTIVIRETIRVAIDR